MDEVYEKSIILIGPSGAGKSTLADALSKRLNMPRISLDSVSKKFNYKDFVSGDVSYFEKRNIEMMKELLGHVVIPGICDFGAGHSVYQDNDNFQIVKDLLSPFANVILLLPSANTNESLDILKSRGRSNTSENLMFLESDCNKELATAIIYTDGKTVGETMDEIIEVTLRKQNNGNIRKQNIFQLF